MGLAGPLDPSRAAERDEPFVIRIENAEGKVDEKAIIVATITTREGFRITESYRHRIVELAASEGVEIPADVVPGSVRDGRVGFLVPVTPRRPGTHSVTGLFRFSYHDGRQLEITSAPFEATVTATR
jgi:hypothetical protein